MAGSSPGVFPPAAMKALVGISVVGSLFLIGAGLVGDIAGHDENFLIVFGAALIAVNIVFVVFARRRGRI